MRRVFAKTGLAIGVIAVMLLLTMALAGPALAVSGTQISGVVQSNDPGPLSGATVKVVLNALDSLYDPNNAANNLVGQTTTDGSGNYTINVTAFRSSAGLQIGSKVDISALKTGYLSVTQYGTFDQASITVSFLRFSQIFGSTWGDRRVPVDEGQQPPLPYENLLPNYLRPTLTGLSPSSGGTGGGTGVTITGTNFIGTPAPTVSFGGTAATNVVVVSATSITCTSPPHGAGAVDVTATTQAGTTATSSADQFTYTTVPAPTVTGLSPTSGTTSGGTSVTITGTNLTGATAVSFGGTAATGVSVVNATTVTATSPVHAPARLT